MSGVVLTRTRLGRISEKYSYYNNILKRPVTFDSGDRCCNVSYRKWSLSLSIDIGSLCNQPGFSVNAGFRGLVDAVRHFDTIIVPIYNALNV